MTQPDPTLSRTVVRLEADSYKRLRAVEVTPSATGMIPVRGRNAQGKSSLIEAMLDALGATKCEMPIREGEASAHVVLDLGDIVIKKRWTRDADGEAKSALTIEGNDGGKVSGPAGVLASLRGHFADPVAFLGLAATEQVKVVLGALGLAQELDALESRAAAIYDRRRDLGREADRAAKAAAGLAAQISPPSTPARHADGPEGDEDTGEEETATLDGLAALLQNAKDHNASIESARIARSRAESRGKELASQIAELEEELKHAREQKETCAADWKAATAILNSSSPMDTEPIVVRMRACESAARNEGQLRLLAAAQAEAARARELHEQSEVELTAARQAIQNLLGSAQFPVPGMAYDSERKILTVGGIPFAQASQAERLKIAAAVAMAGSPSIRVLFAREGSLLDDESRAQLATLAAASGFQLWVEMVDSNPEGAGIWIEDGHAYQAVDVKVKSVSLLPG